MFPYILDARSSESVDTKHTRMYPGLEVDLAIVHRRRLFEIFNPASFFCLLSVVGIAVLYGDVRL